MPDMHVDFTRPEGSRTRPLLVEGRSLYVCEHYMSIWSPVLKQFIIECPNRELILPNIRFEHMLEVLECISPMSKEINGWSLPPSLVRMRFSHPLAFFRKEPPLYTANCR